MGLSSEKIKSKSFELSETDSMTMAAQAAGGSEDEVRKAVAEIVTAMLENRWALVRWIIGEEWAALLVARIVDAIGQTLLEWLR